VTHALGRRRSPGGGPQELLNISLTGVTEGEQSMISESGRPENGSAMADV
jgi:hypothetical protein